MARGRIISKSIATSEKVNLILRNPLDCLLYTWGLCHADDEGRIEGNPITFRGKVAPMLPGLTDTRVDLALTSMEKAGLIARYTVQGVMTCQFFDWNNHQSFNGRHKIPSKLPPIPKDIKTLKNVHNTEPLSQMKLNEVKRSNTFEQINPARDFESLWKQYPKRLGKKASLKHFMASVKGEVDLVNIKKALINYIASRVGEEAKYTKHGSTWFNEWTDWIDYKPENKKRESDEDLG